MSHVKKAMRQISRIAFKRIAFSYKTRFLFVFVRPLLHIAVCVFNAFGSDSATDALPD